MDLIDKTATTCRICLKNSTNDEYIQSVFNTNDSAGELLQFSEMLMSFASIKVIEDDELPQQICSNCAQNTIKTYLFKTKCEESDKTLRNRLQMSTLIGGMKLDEESVMNAIIKSEITDDNNSGGIQLTQLDSVEILVFEAETDPLAEPTESAPLSPILEKSQETLSESEKLREQKIAELSKQIKLTEEKLDSKKYELNTTKDKEIIIEDDEDETEKKIVPEKSSNETSQFRKPKIHQCEFCKRCFNRAYILTKHRRIHTGEKPYECNYCPRRFRNAEGFIVHTRTHTGEKPYKCDVCTFAFNNSSSLQRHKRVHTGEKPYECKICHERFIQSSLLQRHLTKHTGEKPHRCEVCLKDFAVLKALITHRRSHLGKTPFKCTICERKFKLAASLARHRRMHLTEEEEETESEEEKNVSHVPKKTRERVAKLKSVVSLKNSSNSDEKNQTNSRTLKCDHCEMRFPTIAALNTHKHNLHNKSNNLHTYSAPLVDSEKHKNNAKTLFQCEICNKSFDRAPVLERHKRTHAEELYECDICNKKFSERKLLNSHIRKHPERKFECDLCKFKFSEVSSLLRHQRMHKVLAKKKVNNLYSSDY